MRIISKKRDYYDFIAKKYGGGDPKIVYERKDFGPTKYMFMGREQTSSYPLSVDVISSDSSLGELRFYNRFKYRGNTEECYIKYLCVCGELYLLISFKLSHYELYDENTHFNKLFPDNKRYTWFDNFFVNMKKSKEAMIKVAREIKQPVFIVEELRHLIDSKWLIRVEGSVPNLKDLGFSAIKSPEQLYQDISYFMGNIIHESPDMKPPVDVSDKDRYVQHGFDPVKSFRHRKE